jgi:hypothetical protein
MYSNFQMSRCLMKGWRQRGLLFIGLVLAWAGFTVAEQVDPRFPEERLAEVHEKLEWWPHARIQQLEAERDQLLEKISLLPQHDPIFSSDRLGYHSSVGDPESDEVSPPHQLVIKLGQRRCSIRLRWCRHLILQSREPMPFPIALRWR